MTTKEAFKAGWAAGYSDGGEHDCRMFTPTAERAWEHHQYLRAFNAKPLAERAKSYRCPSCLGGVEVVGTQLRCKDRCRWSQPFNDPAVPA